jgi:hypothetical protein
MQCRLCAYAFVENPAIYLNQTTGVVVVIVAPKDRELLSTDAFNSRSKEGQGPWKGEILTTKQRNKQIWDK